ncbi:MAG: Rho termination factor N-terminal domain-containing protein, partial [Thermoguttaceae bacterium]|nr:Rho termination factor N-terminal domain-containing protein [Thermoguttaceae bacterium]
MTAAQLKSRTAKDLAQLAKRKGIAGWHSMRKDELVQALIRFSKTESARRNGSNGSHDSVSARKNGKSLETEPSRNGHSHGNGDRSATSKAKSAKT